MPPYKTRNNCSQEPAKYVPTITEVKVSDIPENFPNICKKMIGEKYPAIVHTDRRGNTWYKILKELVFGKTKEFSLECAFERKDEEKVSFTNRKYIDLQAKYCYCNCN